MDKAGRENLALAACGQDVPNRYFLAQIWQRDDRFLSYYPGFHAIQFVHSNYKVSSPFFRLLSSGSFLQAITIKINPFIESQPTILVGYFPAIFFNAAMILLPCPVSTFSIFTTEISYSTPVTFLYQARTTEVHLKSPDRQLWSGLTLFLNG